MIREIRGSDCQAVVALWNRCLTRDLTTEARFAAWLFADADFDTEHGKGAWVEESGGQIAGFVRAIRRELPNDRLGTESSLGWIPVVFVAPEHRRKGIGTELLEKALAWLRENGVEKVWVCGNSGSAPGYLFPGIDMDVYADAKGLFEKCGFVTDRQAVSMTTTLLDYDPEYHEQVARRGGAGEGITIETLSPASVMNFFTFLRTSFPGDWNTAARNKVKAGDFSRVLIAWNEGEVVGYCQWEDDGHFGPFGVAASMRGKGVGALLFLESCRRLKKTGAREVWFNWADPGAARFYGRLGLNSTRTFHVVRKDF
ncbi:MAG: hypothetical protein PWP23_2055 [Candidatus Sumerlaeota bacterium]|nr:hypothetical protein [Candidatus Sumerlaeota bacterium]